MGLDLRAMLIELWPDVNLPKRIQETWTVISSGIRALPVPALLSERVKEIHERPQQR